MKGKRIGRVVVEKAKKVVKDPAVRRAAKHLIAVIILATGKPAPSGPVGA